MRNMSFMLTTAQVRNKTKTVTRRFGWWFLKPGDRVMACEQCQGLGKGGKMVRIRELEIVSTRRERVDTMIDFPRQYLYGVEEVVREGFPTMTPAEFVAMLCTHNKKLPSDDVNRIAFKYVEGGA